MPLRLLLVLFLVGCQSKPTRITEESANQQNKQAIIVDTRPSIEFESFHISGSISLRTEDFLILKEPKTKKRILDPDLSQTVERLAKKGIAPFKAVILLSGNQDLLETKKWNWLLKKIGILEVTSISFEEYRRQNPKRLPQAPPEAMPVWQVSDSKLILEKADKCFVNYSQKLCEGD